MISKPGFSQPGESPRWRSNHTGSTAIQPEVSTPRDETACPILQIHQKAEPSAVCYWVGCLVGAHGNRVLRSVSVVSRISEIQDKVAVLGGVDDCRLRSSSAAAAARTAMVAVVGCSEPDRGLAKTGIPVPSPLKGWLHRHDPSSARKAHKYPLEHTSNWSPSGNRVTKFPPLGAIHRQRMLPSRRSSAKTRPLKAA